MTKERIPKPRRRPTKENLSNPVLQYVQRRGEQFVCQISKALQDESNRLGGVASLEKAIRAATGGFAFIERRKLKTLIDAPLEDERDPKKRYRISLSAFEIAALDLFWKETGGFIGKLRMPTLLDYICKSERLIAFLPSHPDSDKGDGEKLGYVPVADVRAATEFQKIVFARNSRLLFEVEEIASGNEDQNNFEEIYRKNECTFQAMREFGMNFIHDGLIRAQLISFGSSRTNSLSRSIIHRCFPRGAPFDFKKEGDRRFLLLENEKGTSKLTGYAVICVKHTAEGFFEVVIAGDRSLSTIGATREVANYAIEKYSPGMVEWALVKVETDSGEKKVLTSQIVHYGRPSSDSSSDEEQHFYNF